MDTSTILITRSLWALAIIMAGLAIYWLHNRSLLLQVARQQSGEVKLPGYCPGTPAIVCFSSPDCAPCKTIQHPALNKIKELMGDRLQIIEIDTQNSPDLASHWGIMSVPTTFVLDGAGKSHFINHGATRSEKLLEQLKAIS